jgi:predicted nucleic-acid-binding protein
LRLLNTILRAEENIVSEQDISCLALKELNREVEDLFFLLNIAESHMICILDTGE